MSGLFKTRMDQEIFRLATLIILFFFFVVGVDAISGSLSWAPARRVPAAPPWPASPYPPLAPGRR
ncbi:MAG: hypothetical protein ACM3XN_09965 [Chloroflexota bacterium]